MILNIRHFLLLVSLFVIAPNAFGQDELKSIELKKILDAISVQHSIKFNYLEEEVRGHSIFPPDAKLPLKAKLVYITNRTGLLFKKVDEYYVVHSGQVSEAKKLCAYVIDDFGYPIDNAVIQFMPGNRKIVTGSDGYFELSHAEKGTLYIGQLGYEEARVHVSDFTDDCMEIVLHLEVTELDAIIAERYIATGISKREDGSFVIKPRKFGILPGLIEPDVLQAMQQLPGISSIDETVSNINVRGGTHDQNLFMWNGIRLFQTGHFFGLISALNPNLAHEIKIYKNGTSAFYGESVSSAVDISSRPKDIGEGSTSFGTNMINLDFYTKIKASENTNFEISARRSFTDIIDFPTYSKYSKRIFQNTVVTALNNSEDVNYRSDKEFYFYDFTGQFHQKIDDKHDLYIDVIGINNNLDFIQGTITDSNVVTEASSLRQYTLGGTAGWRTQWDDEHSTEIGIYGSYYDVDATNSSIEVNQVMKQENNILDAGFRFSNTNSITSLIKLHSGYQYNEVGVENSDEINLPEYGRNEKRVLRSHALIGEAEYDSQNQKLHSRLGLRGNYIEQFAMVYFEPRLQLNYLFSNQWQLDVLAEMKSQTTTQIVELQGDFLGIEKRRWVLANDGSIPVQRSRQASIGISYKDNSNGWLVSLENFYKKVKGITTSGQSFQDQLEQVQATGNYTVYGTEFLVQKQFKGFHAWLSYTWNTNDYKFDNVDPEKFPSNFEIRHSINTAAIYEWKDLKIALGSKWFTGRPVTPPLSDDPILTGPVPRISYGSPNSDNIDDFFQVNFSASYTIRASEKSQLQLGVAVLNIFNKKNIINTYYRINNSGDAIEMVNTFALERTPNALIRFSF